MFCLNIALGNISWRLLFKNDESLKAAELPFLIYAGSPDTWILAVDDFGQTVRVRQNAIHGVMVEDLDKTKLAHVELVLHQARTQSLATKMAQTDPALKADTMSRSPAILSPMGNGARPFS